MRDAFGVEHGDAVSKAWKGEPGDKRNTKFALATLGGTNLGSLTMPVTGPIGPIVGGIGGAAGYGAWRSSKKGRSNRMRSIEGRLREKKAVSDLKRKYQ